MPADPGEDGVDVTELAEHNVWSDPLACCHPHSSLFPSLRGRRGVLDWEEGGEENERHQTPDTPSTLVQATPCPGHTPVRGRKRRRGTQTQTKTGHGCEIMDPVIDERASQIGGGGDGLRSEQPLDRPIRG